MKFPSNSNSIGPKQVILGLPSDRHRTRNHLALAIIFAQGMVWIGVFFTALHATHWAAKLIVATMIGVVTGTLFVVGHDCCHGGYLSSRVGNRIAALLAFMPSLHPPEAWTWSHNKEHHSWTNLRGRDLVYAPITLSEWDSFSATRKVLYRVFYSMSGMGLYYAVTVWWHHIFLPSRAEQAHFDSIKQFRIERTLMLAVVISQCALIAQNGAWRGSIFGTLSEILLLVVWPFFIWNWVMAFVTIQHHTHPRVRWFDDPKEWSYFQSQVAGTVHLRLPAPIALAFGNIFEHTAHHADKRIPLYNLKASQQNLSERFASHVIEQPASLRHLRDVLSRCRLYDYREHRWMDFEGNYTT